MEPATLTKYRRVAGLFGRFATAAGSRTADEITLETLDCLRASQAACALTWNKELQLLRQFFSFCIARKWTEENPAKQMRMPPDPKPKERAPYTREEVMRILMACETFGRNAYELSRALVLLPRF